MLFQGKGKDNIVLVLMINGGYVLDGKVVMLMMLKLQITIRNIKQRIGK